MSTWLKFIICSAAMIYAGYKLSFYGNIISEKTHITKLLIGFIFLSVATSLPEFITSASSITLIHSPDLAVGNMLGTIVINLMIIALLDLIQGSGPLLSEARKNHILSGGLTIILLGIVCFSTFLRSQLQIRLGIFGFGLESLLLVFIFILGIRLIFLSEKTNQISHSDESKGSPLYAHISLKSVIVKFCLYFISIVILGIWLALIGEEVVSIMGWSESLVGTTFLALATSLPELIVSITALTFAVDMAIGNILGSNFFDIMIIPLSDFLFREGELLSHISIAHLATLMLGIILTSIIIVGLIYRSRKSFLKLGWDAIAMIVTFCVGGYFLIRLM